MEKNKIIADFDKTKFWFAYKENAFFEESKTNTYEECKKWIKENIHLSQRKGWKPKLDFDLQNGNYQKDWEWLMPVIEQISKSVSCDFINTSGNKETCNDIYPRTFGMINSENGNFMFRFNRFSVHEAKKLIDCAYEAVVEVLESEVFKK